MSATTLEPSIQAPSEGTGAVIHLPAGMMGLPEVTHFELVACASNPPLMWLRSLGETAINFPVVEPGPLVPDYQVKLSDNDAETLAVDDDSTPLVLNVLTVKSLSPQRVTLNLVAPIVINRTTLTGKQVVLENYERYSVEHLVIDETPGALAC